MQYWAVIDNERKGPMTLEELVNLNIFPETLVWREGLTEWIPAKDLCELSQLFVNHVEPPVVPNPIQTPKVEPEVAQQEQTQAKATYQAPYCNPYQPQPAQQWGLYDAEGRPCPPTYLVFAIITLACCCQIFGIVALVYATQVKSLYMQGEYEKSKKYSQNALIWSFVALGSGIIATIVYAIIQIFFTTSPSFMLNTFTSYMP